MKLTSTISRYLLGLMFFVFGLNGFLHFIPQPPPQAPLALQFMTAAAGSHFLVLVFFLETVAGLLLLAGRFIPLALTLLAPILVCILNFHFTMDPKNAGPGVVAVILWFAVWVPYRASFAGVLQSQSASR